MQQICEKNDIDFADKEGGRGKNIPKLCGHHIWKPPNVGKRAHCLFSPIPILQDEEDENAFLHATESEEPLCYGMITICPSAAVLFCAD